MHRLTIGYAGALLLIAVLSGMAHFLLDSAISDNQDSATIINAAGRQRMLSQRIAAYARDVYYRGDADAKGALLDATNLMWQSHRALLNGSGDLGITHPL
jgi:nitrate/nitrite-specific signal transduction histidine kinase